MKTNILNYLRSFHKFHSHFSCPIYFYLFLLRLFFRLQCFTSDIALNAPLPLLLTIYIERESRDCRITLEHFSHHLASLLPISVARERNKQTVIICIPKQSITKRDHHTHNTLKECDVVIMHKQNEIIHIDIENFQSISLCVQCVLCTFERQKTKCIRKKNYGNSYHSIAEHSPQGKLRTKISIHRTFNRNLYIHIMMAPSPNGEEKKITKERVAAFRNRIMLCIKLLRFCLSMHLRVE